MRKNDSEGSSPTKPSPGHFIALREEQHGRCLVFSLPEPLFWSHCTGNNRTEKQFSCLLLWHGWGGVLCFLCRNISKLLCRSRAALDPITSTANAIISTPTQCSFTTWPCFSNNCMSLCIYPRKHRPSQQALNSLLTGISGLQGSATCFSLPFSHWHHLLHSISGNSSGLPQHNLWQTIWNGSWRTSGGRRAALFQTTFTMNSA